MTTEYEYDDDTQREHNEILDRHGVTEISDTEYHVTGSTGSVYTVRFAGAYDGGNIHTWDCTCPARVTCRHIKAVAAAHDELAALHGWD